MSIEEAQKLPAGWRWVKLGDVCSTLSGGTPQKDQADFWSGDIPWVSPKDMSVDHITNSEDHISEQAIVASATKLISPPALLVVVRSGILARRLPVAVVGTTLAFNQDIKAVMPTTCVDIDFLALSIRSRQEDILLHGVKKGATVHSIKSGYLENLRIPLPPLPEQKRIATILTEKMAAVEKARAAAEVQLKAAKELPAAYLREVFESQEAQRWPIKLIGDFAKVQSGYAFKSDWFAKTGIRLLRNANVFQGYLDWNDVVHLPEDRRREFPTYELAAGDIVLSLDRPWVSNGLKVSRLAETDLPCLLLQRVGRFCINDGLEPDYLYTFLNSPAFIDEITGHDQSLGVPHVSPKQIEAIDIPVPPRSKQKEIANELKCKKATTESLAVMLENELTAISRLPAALLRQAFQGEL